MARLVSLDQRVPKVKGEGVTLVVNPIAASRRIREEEARPARPVDHRRRRRRLLPASR